MPPVRSIPRIAGPPYGAFLNCSGAHRSVKTRIGAPPKLISYPCPAHPPSTINMSPCGSCFDRPVESCDRRLCLDQFSRPGCTPGTSVRTCLHRHIGTLAHWYVGTSVQRYTAHTRQPSVAPLSSSHQQADFLVIGNAAEKLSKTEMHGQASQ